MNWYLKRNGFGQTLRKLNSSPKCSKSMSFKYDEHLKNNLKTMQKIAHQSEYTALIFFCFFSLIKQRKGYQSEYTALNLAEGDLFPSVMRSAKP